jgi:hypothetical protein
VRALAALQALQADARAGHDGGLLDAELTALPSAMSKNETNPRKQANTESWDWSDGRIGDGAGILEAVLDAAIALPAEAGAG